MTVMMMTMQASQVAFPVLDAGASFMPFIPDANNGAWSGYFTSRPVLKRSSRVAESTLYAAESLFARAPTNATAGSLWGSLERSRQLSGIVQHHDAITGTECRKEEGCSGTNQVSEPSLSEFSRALN